ncbi:MAG: hypothetical protein M0R48_11780 [Candidatus Omnitrophica bacterium]|nr:hypothetical protein [Candidatus Omnitrophota bacterium]
MIIKNGVQVVGLQKEIITALPTIDNVISSVASYLVITSALEGRHSKDSLHPKGLAIDIRLPYLDPALNVWICKVLRLRLGNYYDVVLEVDHIHIEFDPE